MSEENVLPPFVYGKLRGHLTVKVDEIFWVKTSPSNIFVELLWWGEKESHILKPACINRLGNVNEQDTSVTFNIRTSLQLFENYIKKSGKLILGVFKFPSREHLGDVTVWNPAATIFSGKLEQGYYPIFNKNKVRVGDLRISFELWMTKKDSSDKESGQSTSSSLPIESAVSNLPRVPQNFAINRFEKNSVEPLLEVLNRGKELRDAMTMSVLEDAPVDNIEKILSRDNDAIVNNNPGSIDANKLMDFLMGKELAPDQEVLAIKTLRSVSPTQSVVNDELKSRCLTSSKSKSCSCCFKHNNSCSSSTSRSLSNPVSCTRPHSCQTIRPQSKNQTDEVQQSKDIFEVVNCFKLVVQCLHLNTLGVKKVKASASKPSGKVQRKPGLYYMIEHLPPSHRTLSKEKPWNVKQTRFVSRKINENEITFGESNYLVEGINGSFSWSKVFKQLSGTSLKVYWRYQNQRLASYLGSCVIKEDSVRPSGLFCSLTLPVNSNSAITGAHLSLLVELGHSDSKTFGSHLLNYGLNECNKEDVDKEDASCECSGCRLGKDIYDPVCSPHRGKKTRDVVPSSDDRCSESGCDNNAPTRSTCYNDRLDHSTDKLMWTESRKSSDNASYQYHIREVGGEKVLCKNEDKDPSDYISNKKEKNELKVVEVPRNIAVSLRSYDGCDSVSYQSDSVKNDLKVDVGNMRPSRSTTDTSCQVSLESNTPSIAKSLPAVRSCKSCLAMSKHKHKCDAYPCQSQLSSNHSTIQRSHHPPIYRDPNLYNSTNYCHCCPLEFPSHKCCYEMASTQVNGAGAHFYHTDPSPYVREHPYYSQPMTVHEISICIDKISHLPLFSQELNEDADCFVDYTFPINQRNRGERRYSTELSLISKGEVEFSTVTKHTFTVPTSTNINDLFTSLAFPSLDFNIWYRFYRSTPVDHVIAKAILPVERICSLKQEFDESGGDKVSKDKVCLPLLTVASPLSVQYPTKMSGTMEVTILYKNFNIKEATLDLSTSKTNSKSTCHRNEYCKDQVHYHYNNTGIDCAKRGVGDSCCNNINYNTIARSSSKNFLKSDIRNCNCVGSEGKVSVSGTGTEEKAKRDQALSPIQELSIKSKSETDQIENLRQSLERLVEQAENNQPNTANSKQNNDSHSSSSLESDLEKYRNVVQLESSSDEGLDSIVPKVNANMRKAKAKTAVSQQSKINQQSEYEASNKGNPRSVDSENIQREIHDNFDVLNLSDDDTLKSLCSVNSDDSSSGVGFIAFNKDFNKNNYKARNTKQSKKQESNKTTTQKQRPKEKLPTMHTQTKFTQTLEETAQMAVPVGSKQLGSFFKVKIDIERAMNLCLLAAYGTIDKQKPSSYVSFDAYINGNLEHITSDIVYNCTDPVWNASWNVMLPIEYLYKCDKKFIINVMVLSDMEDGGPGRACLSNEQHTTTLKSCYTPKGAVRKQACIDLNSLCAGLNVIVGWYSLVSESTSTSCTGHLKVKITPLEDISKHKSMWFKEYLEWEKTHCKWLSCRKKKTDNDLKPKIITADGSIKPKLDTPNLANIKKADSIDRDLVYISLNQKLSELDKISELFRDKNRSSDTYPATSSKNAENIFAKSICLDKASNTSKDILDLNIDKDICFINKLLSEGPSIQMNSINKYDSNESHSNQRRYLERIGDDTESNHSLRLANEIPEYRECMPISEQSKQTGNSVHSDLYYCNSKRDDFQPGYRTNNGNKSKECVSFTGANQSIYNRHNEPLNESFNASDILDLEELRTEETSYKRGDYVNDRDFNYKGDEISLSNDKTDSKSDNNLNLMASQLPTPSPYHSCSPQVSLDKESKSQSSCVPLECRQPCSGSGLDSRSCIFNNRKLLDNNNFDSAKFDRFSPFNSDNGCQVKLRQGYIGSGAERFSCDSDRSEVILSKDVEMETLSGHSSLCTDDHSTTNNYSQPDNQHVSVSENTDDINSDLMEEASSEIDRILRELKKQ